MSMQASLGVRKDLESHHHCRGPVKLVNASLHVKNNPKSRHAQDSQEPQCAEDCFLDSSLYSNWREEASQDLSSGENCFLDLS